METPVVFTEHSPSCKHKGNRFWRRCNCRKWLYVPVTRRRISAKTRSWEAAEKLAKELAHGEPTDAPTGKSVRMAVQSFVEDKRQQGLSKSWERKLDRELGDLTEWCESRVPRLADVSKCRMSGGY